MRNRHRRHSTLGCPDQDSADLATWYPTRVLVNGFDIIVSGGRSAIVRAETSQGAWNRFHEAEDNRSMVASCGEFR